MSRWYLLFVCSLPALAQTLPPDCRVRIAEDFVPMTVTERLREAQFSVAGPTPLALSALKAGFGSKQPEGYGRRVASVYAENVIGQFIEQGISYKLHEDNRYFGSGKRNPFERIGYAVSSTFLARHDDGSRSVSISAIGGPASAAFISRAWQPRNRSSAGDAAVSFGLTMAVRAGFNVLREFSPGLLGRVLR